MQRAVWLTFGVSLAFGTVAALAAPTRGPAVASRWQNVKISQEECLKRAEDAIRLAGFGQLERTEQSRYGTKENYTGVVRCITEKGIVFFIGSGMLRPVADKLSLSLFQNFKAE